MVKSLRCVPTSATVFPKLINAEWVASNATIIGDVTVGKFCSFFHGVTIRGDNCKVTIGQKTVIQDNTLLSTSDHENKNSQIIIGDKVNIGVNCNIDSCRIDDGAVISNGATIHRNCHIQAGSMVAAGAVVRANTVVPSGQIFAGNPAQYLRDLKPEELVNMSESQTEMRELANVMVEACEKNHVEFLNDHRYRVNNSFMTNEDRFIKSQETLSWWTDPNFDDDFGVEGGFEGLDEYENEGLQRYTAGKIFKKESMDSYYEMDSTNYPDAFKIYSENFDKYDKMRGKFENEMPGESAGFPQRNEPTRPGAMRAWISKWDPDYNTQFRQTGTKMEHRGF